MKNIYKCLKVFLLFTLLLGVIYPLFIFLIAQGLMPGKANGSLIMKDGKVVGSKLIGQEFAGVKYFHSRPSANNNDGTNSGGSNLGPSSSKLMTAVEANVKNIIKENDLKGTETVPADMVLASASSLDPHISLKNALLQLPRVAKARKLAEKTVEEMVNKNIDPDMAGLWGKKGVNVLKLNIALDEAGLLNKGK